jgi:hypothetical protein
MDLQVQRLSQGEKIAAGSALILFVCMFLSWFDFGFGSVNAWDSLHYVSPILAITIAATLTITLLKASGRDAIDLPLGSVIFVLGCVATLLLLFRLIDPISAGGASPFGGGEGLEDGGSPEAGLFLGLLAAAGMAVGGYMASSGKALDQMKAIFAGGGPTPPQQTSPLPPVEMPPPGGAPAQAPAPPVAPPPAPPVAAPAPPPPPAAAPPAPPQPAADGAETVEGGLVFCEHCRARIRESDRFCGECGQPTAAR